MNWVRLSHYPHDPDFLDACDERGLMLLEEGPTWMRDNGEAWTENLLDSFRSMIRRDRNHPSIIVWNACINHSGYHERLGAVCAEEDDRPAGAKLPPTPMDFRHEVVSGNGALTIEHTGHTYPRGRGQVRPDGTDGEWELAKRHWEHISASRAAKDNAGMAVWCMFDYNTFHNIDENGIVWHGVCDLTRIPKQSYVWHTSELTDVPMAYVVNYRKGKACVFSNCEKIELFEDTGHGFESLGVKAPIAGLNLVHPPFMFDVSADAVALKAVGTIRSRPVAAYTWKKPGRAESIVLEADSKLLAADGSDLTRLVATAVDGNRVPVDHLASQVYFSVRGPGTIIGDHPAPFRAGKAVVLLRSHYAVETLEVVAESPGLDSDTVRVVCVRPAANVLLPQHLPAFPARTPVADRAFAYLSDLAWSFQSSEKCPGFRCGVCGLRRFEHNGKVLDHVLLAGIPARVRYELAGLYKAFTARLLAMNGEVCYEVTLDGELYCRHEALTEDLDIEVPLEGVSALQLIARPKQGVDNAVAPAVWANARLSYGKSATLRQPQVSCGATDIGTAAVQDGEALPAPVSFASVRNAKPRAYVESNIVMIAGAADQYPITIRNGEYRVYSGPWTDKPGLIIPGDALTVRVKAAQGTVRARVRIGAREAVFEVESREST